MKQFAGQIMMVNRYLVKLRYNWLLGIVAKGPLYPKSVIAEWGCEHHCSCGYWRQYVSETGVTWAGCSQSHTPHPVMRRQHLGVIKLWWSYPLLVSAECGCIRHAIMTGHIMSLVALLSLWDQMIYQVVSQVSPTAVWSAQLVHCI